MSDQLAIPGIHLGPTGLDLPVTSLDTPAIVGALDRLSRIDGAARWALGDLAAELWAREGPQALQILAGQGHNPATLTQAVAVSTAIPPARRRPALSWTHHHTVAVMCPGHDDQQDDWLARAEHGDDPNPGQARRPWSARTLRDHIAASRQQPQLPGTETLPRPPQRSLRAALTESPVVMWIPAAGQLSPAHVRHIDTLADGATVAVVTIDPALAGQLTGDAA